MLGVGECLILSINYHLKVYYTGASFRSNEFSMEHCFGHELSGWLECHSQRYDKICGIHGLCGRGK